MATDGMGADGQPQRKSTIPEWLRADVARLASLNPAGVCLQLTYPACPEHLRASLLWHLAFSL